MTLVSWMARCHCCSCLRYLEEHSELIHHPYFRHGSGRYRVGSEAWPEPAPGGHHLQGGGGMLHRCHHLRE